MLRRQHVRVGRGPLRSVDGRRIILQWCNACFGQRRDKILHQTFDRADRAIPLLPILTWVIEHPEGLIDTGELAAATDIASSMAGDQRNRWFYSSGGRSPRTSPRSRRGWWQFWRQ